MVSSRRLYACRIVPVVAFLLVPAAAGAQQPSFGPLTSEEGAPLHRISLTATTETAELSRRGALTFEIWNGFSNIFEQDSSATHVLFLDMERLLSTLTVRWGATERVEVGARLSLETTGPGTLDGTILAWHNRLGFGNANRDRFPEGVYRQRLTDGGTSTYLDIPRRTLGLGDVRIFAKWSALESLDGRTLLTLKGTARVPGDVQWAGEARTDLAITALGRVGMGAWYGHAMVGGSTVRAAPELDAILRNGSVFAAIAVERSLGSWVAAVVQFQMQSAILTSFDHRELDRAPTNLVLGLAGRWGEAWRWDVSFQEDVPADTPAIDFTVGLRVSRRW
ncbi:MAG: DUF3187 family protein [Gemmatimonadetes bacterium]|nr:DUF3187 family protein [Gemmatimonadota bacterium]